MAETTPNYGNADSYSAEASATIKARNCLEVSGTRTVAPTAGPGGAFAGVAAYDVPKGELVTVRTTGVHTLRCTGDIAAGARVTTAPGGAVTVGEPAIGIAQSTSVGGAVRVKLIAPGGISDAAMDSLYLPEAADLFNRMSVRPDVDRRAAINTMIRNLKSYGLWEKLVGGVWNFAAHRQPEALLNWRRSTADFTAVSSPTFEADIGFSGNGAGSYLLLPQNAINTVGIQGSDISLSLWISRKQYVSTESAFAGMSYGWNVVFVPADTGTTARWVLTRSSGNGGWMTTTTSRTGLFTLSRPSGGSTAHLYRDGSLIGTDSRANDSGSYGATEISIFKSASYGADLPANYATGTVSFCALGVGLTASETAMLYNVVNDYMAAVDLANKLGL